MSDRSDQTESLAPLLEAQAQLLQRLHDQTREYFFKGETTVPTQVLDDFQRLTSGLSELRHKALGVEQRGDNLLALAQISQVINSSLEPDEVLRIVMDTIVRLLKAERGFLMLRNPQGELSIQIARNWGRESIQPHEFAISRTIVNQVIQEGKPVLTTNAQQDPRFEDQESVVAFNLRSILCVPLQVKDVLTGVIYADNRIRTGIFTQAELDLLSALANQAAVAIENARLFESLRRTLVEVTDLKNLMANVFASVASGVITTDTHGRITLGNRAAELILGANELTGRELSQLLPEIGPQITRHITWVGSGGPDVVGAEFETCLPGRGPVNLSLNFSPLREAGGEIQGVALVLDDLTEKKRLQAQRRLFERMVSPAVIDQLDPSQPLPPGRRTQITTLFADIRGFTAFSERHSPEELVAVLNRYLGAAADAVLAQDGTIDKFLGDAVMAWFNAPLPQPDHTLRAVRAGLEIGRRVVKLQAELPPELRLSYGVGIHFGEAVLGLVGTAERLDYTAIGDSVNTARRIQENAAAGQVLISAAAYAQVSEQVEARPAGSFQAKGKSQPVVVYEVVGEKS